MIAALRSLNGKPFEVSDYLLDLPFGVGNSVTRKCSRIRAAWDNTLGYGLLVHVAIGGWKTVLIRMTSPQVTHFVQPLLPGAEAGVWFFLSENNARTCL
ncbi:hypothetical protein Tco_0313918 [Tanacetum coccineum]